MSAEQPPAASWGADTDGRLNQSSEHLTEHAMLSTDASGNTVLVGGDGLPVVMSAVTNITRNSLGLVDTFVSGNVTYSVTYGDFGVATVTGGGSIITVNRDASGLVTGFTTT